MCARLLHKGEYPKGHSEVTSDPIIHDCELAIWRVERQGSQIRELIEVRALVEVAVVQSHSAVTSTVEARTFHHNVLVQRQLEFRIPHEIGFHENASINRTVHHETIRAHQHRDTLQDVNEDLVLLLALRIVLCESYRPLDSIAGDGTRIPVRQIQPLFGRLDEYRFVVNARLQVLSVRCLRMAEVYHFIQQLVHQHEVFADAFLVQNTTEVFENLGHFREKLHHCRGRHIRAHGSYEVETSFFDENVADTVHVENWRRVPGPELDLPEEDLSGPFNNISAKVTSNDGVTSKRQDVEL
mmetsp:Transcript_2518/g.7460  ORF Transcript_2518/g.7460 Transcript_2518/m.7460 type:complete len:298 (-) Transcript_2518:69-962(-)